MSGVTGIYPPANPVPVDAFDRFVAFRFVFGLGRGGGAATGARCGIEPVTVTGPVADLRRCCAFLRGITVLPLHS